MASKLLYACYENDKRIEQGKELHITQDLLVYKLDLFYNRTVLDMAMEAEAKDFVGLSPVQDYLSDVWYERINPGKFKHVIAVSIVFVRNLLFFLDAASWKVET